MFEDSLFASQYVVVSTRSRWAAAASIAVQAAAASLLVILPVLHTEALPDRVSAISVVMPIPVQPPPPRSVVQRVSNAVVAAVPVVGRILLAPRITPSRIDASPEPVGPVAALSDMGAVALPGALAGGGTGGGVVVTPAAEKKAGPMRVSAGISAGMLLVPIRPVYPQIAKAAHVEGTVVVEAVISKSGVIESLRATSGPAMFQAAAIDAVRAARYQPFRLNGEPTEVQTTITVNFRMGG